MSAESSTVVLVDGLLGLIRRYVVLSEAQALAVALWVMHTHALDACESTPYLSITSAEKRSGKTRLLDVVELVVASPWRTVTPTEAVTFRKIEADRPTLLLDEVDAVFGDQAGNHEGLRALLNAGNRPGTTVPRCVGPSQALREFKVFCAKALAGIGRLPDTVGDRSIPVRLKRRAPGEPVDRFRRREALAAAEPLHQQLTSWGPWVIDRLTDARPEIPDGVEDRAEEAWEPLLAIAELAGAGWSEAARAAASELSTGDEADDESIGVRLLADVRAVFDETGEDKLSSAALVAALLEVETSPWAEWGRSGKELSKTGLARLLGRYRIYPVGVRLHDGTTPRGYHREAFEDAWRRYLGSEVQQVQHPANHAGNEHFSKCNTTASVALAKTGGNPHEQTDVALLQFGTREKGLPPLLGDRGYTLFIAEASYAGHLTEQEVEHRLALHRIVVAAMREGPAG